MKLKNRTTLEAKLFMKKNTSILDYANIMERYAAIGGFSWPLPEDIYIYYFVTNDQKSIVFETYQILMGED